MVKCRVEGCNEEIFCRWYCRRHYMQMYRRGKISYVYKRPKRGTCSVEGCDEVHYARGFCLKHHKQILRNDVIRAEFTKCRVQDCSNKLYSKGFCKNHYAKYLRDKKKGVNMDLYGTIISKITFKDRDKYENYLEHLKNRKKEFQVLNENSISYDGCIVSYDPTINDEADISFD